MTYLWSGMILLGIIYGIFTGNLKAVTEAAVSSSKDAVALCIAMAGVTAMWSGLMKIGEKTGLVQELSRKMRPVMRFLFPRLNPDSKACKYISLNFLSNILGLGWAATPAGLKAMEELNKLEEERRARKVPGQRSVPRGVAGNEMCTFLILNISSLQLIPVNIIAYRSQYGSANPAGIVGPAIAATAVSTAVAVIFCKCMDNKGRIQ
ncbi:MAG: nucleoside recognition protein [Clostridia bacterium]|nr:nucleoside recognition protein [Clostridia bacterium]MDY5555721.1 nucleoside recognition protein [Blautia sp.]